jgi:flagellar export protein FliJ
MKDLHSLIRLHKHELDEKRLVLADLYTALAHLERERRELERAFALEKAAAADTGDIHFTFSTYIDKVNRQRHDIDARAAELDKQVIAAKDSMMETFSELKKYEMTQAQRSRLEAEERALREARELDEIGLETFRRQGEEQGS